MELHKMVDGVKVPLTQDEIDDFNAREAEHIVFKENYEKIKYKYQRLERFNLEGCSDHDLIVALWERIMESDSTSSDEIQIKREEIKAALQKT